jgi:hypothetical protein
MQEDDKTLTKEQVRYRPRPRSAREHCGNCLYFMASYSQGTCALVRGVVDTQYLCDRWEPE